MNVIAPYNDPNTPGAGQSPKMGASIQKDSLKQSAQYRKLDVLFLPATYMLAQGISSVPDANATVKFGGYWISSCKPTFSGPLGLFSFFGNVLDTCEVPDKLQAGDRVKVLGIWTTPVRKYRYANIRYIFAGTVRIGWTIAGQGGDNPWSAIVPDNPTARFPEIGD